MNILDSLRIAAARKNQERMVHLPVAVVRFCEAALSLVLPAALLIATVLFSPAYGESSLFLNEDFNSLENWKPLYFPKIKSHSDYKTVKENSNSVLMLSSSASASAMLLKKSFDVRDFPVISWRWKVENVYKKGNGRQKEGDDYPLRVYIIFEYNPEKAGLFRRAKYNMAKVLYGKYPPDSTVSFVWANREQGDEIITSPFTDRAMIIPLDSAGTGLNEWKTHTVNIVSWYEKAFGEPPPHGNATLAVMNDSDNTGESSVSYIDFIRIKK